MWNGKYVSMSLSLKKGKNNFMALTFLISGMKYRLIKRICARMKVCYFWCIVFWFFIFIFDKFFVLCALSFSKLLNFTVLLILVRSFFNIFQVLQNTLNQKITIFENKNRILYKKESQIRLFTPPQKIWKLNLLFLRQ